MFSKESDTKTRGYQTQKKLLSVAAQLFKKNGYQATSMQAIADALNIKKGSLYYYIRSKEDLLYKLAKTSLEQLLNEARQISEKDATPEEKIDQFIKRHLKLIAENIDLFTVSLRETNEINMKSYWPEIVDLRDRYENILRGILKQGQEEKTFKDYEEKIIGFSLLGMSNWLIRWYQPKSDKDIEYIAHIWSDIFFNGIKTK